MVSFLFSGAGQLAGRLADLTVGVLIVAASLLVDEVLRRDQAGRCPPLPSGESEA
jgi:hypothetical protein